MAWPIAAVAAALLTACQPSSGPRSESVARADVTNWAPVVEPMATPAGEDSTAVQLTSHGDRVAMSWIERAGSSSSVRFSEWTNGAWSPARDVVKAGDLFVNSADVPSVMRVDDGTLIAQWLRETNPAAEAYDLLLSWSRDQGHTWAPPITPHHDGTETQHGFASLFVAPGAAWGVVWLDGRRIDAHAGHGAAAPGSAASTAGAMDLMSATFDDSGRQLSETRVDDRVCDCCPTSVADTSNGPLVAFRDRSPQEVRDIATARFDGAQWSPSRPVHLDNWRIDACPVNGPAVSALQNRVVTAWFTAADDHGRVQAAFSDDAGRSFGAPVLVADQLVRGRVDAALLPDGTAAIMWVEMSDGTSLVKMRRVAETGESSQPATVAGTRGEVLGYPKLQRAGSTLVLAWSENQGFSRVVTATIALAEGASSR